MYQGYYGLRQRPFTLTSNPRYLLLTPAHAEALGSLQYGLEARIGIIVLLGESGTGKTTVLRAALASQPAGHHVVWIHNPLLSRSDFFQHLTHGFGLSAEAAASKTQFLWELTRTLEERVRHGRHTSLIVDEAHALPRELLEEIRLLANIETDEEKLLPVVLAGQPELGQRLNQPDLRQLKQRTALRCTLRALKLRETADYIAGRIAIAGGEAARLFTGEAVKLIHQYSGGVPRTISVVCDNALVAGYAAEERPVDVGTVREVCGDLDLTMTEPAGDRGAQPQPATSGSAGEGERRPARAASFRRLFSL